ncbi:hypothetical protein [Dongia rigui]|uniref:Uncharacterized protein n=1 Tax=Dongia rigui TaxID=940149 RepID=A0ABU5DTP2_9PROT|nr:hypothetical protein [Dongia rigui]MDY0870689.1 hypothetical protein [Dongia rigui]
MGSKQSFLAFLSAEHSAQAGLIRVVLDNAGLVERTVTGLSDARLSPGIDRRGQNRAERDFGGISPFRDE